MEPIKFRGYNCVVAKDQPQYLPFPCYRSLDGEILSCWKLSFLERLVVLFIGRIWQATMTFNNSLQPLMISTRKIKLNVH